MSVEAAKNVSRDCIILYNQNQAKMFLHVSYKTPFCTTSNASVLKMLKLQKVTDLSF